MCVCVYSWDKGREEERRSTLPPHLSPPPTHPSSLLPRHPFHYNDNRIWRAALLLLSEPGLVISLSAPLLLTCMLVSWFIPYSQRPPLKTEGSRLVQGCYSPLLYGLLSFILGTLTSPKKKELVWATGDSCLMAALLLQLPSEAYLFRWRLCLWPFIRAILSSRNFQRTVLPLEFLHSFFNNWEVERNCQGQNWSQIPAEVNIQYGD